MHGSFPVVDPSSKNHAKILSSSPSVTILFLYISVFLVFFLFDNFFFIPTMSFLKVLLLGWGQNQIQKNFYLVTDHVKLPSSLWNLVKLPSWAELCLEQAQEVVPHSWIARFFPLKEEPEACPWSLTGGAASC